MNATPLCFDMQYELNATCLIQHTRVTCAYVPTPYVSRTKPTHRRQNEMKQTDSNNTNCIQIRINKPICSRWINGEKAPGK